MKKRSLILYSLLAAVIVWGIFSWPLPRHVSSGIPASSTNTEKYQVRQMVNGDHLQLHYFFRIFSDMVNGNTPWFHNLYEFNTGNDAERYNVGNYNIPFSLVYLLWDALGSSAFAWNMLGLTTLWLTYLTTWLLLRRYTSELVAGVVALVSITLPYRYISLFGGSPMGYAMLWPPVIVLGLDMAVRDLSFKGGLLAGAALLCAYYNDTRVFLFSVLTAPLWCFVAILHRREKCWTSPKYWGALALRLIPFAAVVLNQVIAGFRVKSEHFSKTALAGGRSVSEVSRFSPDPEGLVEWMTFGKEAHAFIGTILPAICILGTLYALYDLGFKRQSSKWRRDLCIIALAIGGTLTTLLALGPNGPYGGILYMLARKFLPAYNLMRMTVQIYSVMPTILALWAGISIALTINSLKPKQSKQTFLIILIGALFVSEYAIQVRATVCKLPEQQGAYAAVANDADERGRDRRALIIPIWPGDSAWSAPYLYYASLYRIKMINGYSPQVELDYVENIFKRLGRSNAGVLPDENLDFLLERDIDYVILHEDAFPEKVSPFPVCFTLKRLLNHPRLQMLEQDGSIWSFRILKSPRQSEEIKPNWDLFFPSLHWEMEYATGAKDHVRREDGASGGMHVALDEGGTLTLRPFKPWGAPKPALLVRCRGKGFLKAFGTDYRVDSKAWNWLRIKVPSIGTSELLEPEFKAASGTMDIDAMLYLSGVWPQIEEGESITLTAPLFFHAGYTRLQEESVCLRKSHEPDTAIFYGPNLPVPTGRYRIGLSFSSKATDDVRLGSLRVRLRGGDCEETPAFAGSSPARVTLDYRQNLPLRSEFVFSRNADIRLHSLTITRLKSND